MKKVIDGKFYDTEKAEFIGEAHYGYRGDFDHWSEGLYRSPGGQYFIAGEGGARSAYARQVEQNNWEGGEGLRLCTPNEALAWAERYLTADQIAEYFIVTSG